MQKKIFKQMCNEWRANLWLALELLLVSVVLWYIVDRLYCSLAVDAEPHGFDISHCYKIETGVLTPKSPDYKPDANGGDDMRELAERLRRQPDVEAVSLSMYSHPYNGSNGTSLIVYDTLRSPSWTIRRLATPDFVRVFRYRGTRGETPEQLAALLEEGKFLASDNAFRRYGIPLTSLVGKPFHLLGDTTHNFYLGAALQPVRYSDHEEAMSCYSFVCNLNILGSNGVNTDTELCLRVKPGHDRQFLDHMRTESDRLYRVGNLYVAAVRDFASIRASFEQYNHTLMRNYTVGMAFLMLNIFLGLLGTFWFRTQQRRSEIALRMVCGSTRRGLFARLLGEGILLLVVVTPLAVFMDYTIANAGLNCYYHGTTLQWSRLLGCAAASFLFIAFMIVLGILYPACKAMSLQPAEALHDD